MYIDESLILLHLKNLLEQCSVHELTQEENAFIQDRGLENFLYDCIVSPQFKKWNISPTVETRVKDAIHFNITSSQPLHFVLPFGGYKLWHDPVYCEVSWSEFFAVAFYTQYLAPMLASYLPGVVFSFITDDSIIDSMDEVPKSDIEKYFRSFNDLLSSFAGYFPENLKFSLSKAPMSNASGVNAWYSDLTKRRGENKILVSCTPIPEAISLGSTPNSITMFWSGMGVIEQRPEGLVNRIVSRSIWEEIAALPHTEITPNLVDLHNLTKIFVYPEKFGVGKYHRP